MTQTAIVLIVKDTGNVLATVTRAGDPASAPSAADLAGERFPIRDGGGETIVEVPAEALDAKAVPLVDDLLLHPQMCGVQDDAATLIPSAATATVTLKKAGVTVAAAGTVTADTPVWVRLESGAGDTRLREVLTEKIAAGDSDVTIHMTLVQPSYDVAAYITGHVPLVKADEGVT